MWWNLKYSMLYLNRGFELELYLPHELPFIFSYLELLYNSAVNQRTFMLCGIIEDVDQDNIFNTPNFAKKRKRLDKIQKLYLDELVYFQGMSLFAKYFYCIGLMLKNRAMYTMILGCLKEGTIKSYFNEPFQEESAYNKRFKIFMSLLYPTFQNYQKYQEIIKPLSDKKVFLLDTDIIKKAHRII